MQLLHFSEFPLDWALNLTTTKYQRLKKYENTAGDYDSVIKNMHTHTRKLIKKYNFIEKVKLTNKK